MTELFFDLQPTHNPHRWFMPLTPAVCVGPPDSLFMYGRWIAAGNRGELAVYPGAAHGFIAFPCTQTFAALGRMTAFLSAALA